MHLAVDASVINGRRTGVGNYVYELLIRLVQTTSWTFTLYSNQEIVFPEHERVKKIVHTPYRKGAAWINLQLLPALFRDKPDCFWGGNGYLPIVMPKHTKSIVTIHDLVYQYAGHTMPFVSRVSRKWLQPLAAKKSNALVCVSEATATDVKKHYGVEATAIIHPQLSAGYGLAVASEVDDMRKATGLNEPYLLVLGTLEPRKNLSALINAYARAKAEYSELPLLAIAGGKGWMDGELPALIKKYESQKIMKKLGFVDGKHMKALYSGAIAFLFPSIHEGYGMPVTESQLCGTPTIISNIPSLTEAGGGVTVTFEPTELGIYNTLIKLAQKQLPLVCRLHSDIIHDPDGAARNMKTHIEKVACGNE